MSIDHLICNDMTRLIETSYREFLEDDPVCTSYVYLWTEMDSEGHEGTIDSVFQIETCRTPQLNLDLTISDGANKVQFDDQIHDQYSATCALVSISKIRHALDLAEASIKEFVETVLGLTIEPQVKKPSTF